ncbi:hypothetical protein N7449_001413 [Penicillium cf. viridicatum]|uniref:Uncharacterized protein n=1 Tax=Penicillium cf. viridicatum TaxID=2972119 RepID=A0A9W9N6R9_9EURO|nr:hypothetical protein N7449_001413 [Penicillium cf. viridicatum]
MSSEQKQEQEEPVVDQSTMQNTTTLDDEEKKVEVPTVDEPHHYGDEIIVMEDGEVISMPISLQMVKPGDGEEEEVVLDNF